MIKGLIGNLSLIIAMVIILINILLNIFTKKTRNNLITAHFVTLFSFIAFFTLMSGYIFSDFSLLNVINNSHTSKPLIYKITGVWGNHEGSILLILIINTLITSIFGCLTQNNEIQKNQIILVQNIINFALLLYIYLFSNPFIVVTNIPINGYGLNPLLQDIGLASHPPILYAGYISSSIAYSGIIIGLFTNNINRKLFDIIRPWILFSWGTLTIGVMLGSWWAYRELGWGGYWFWDPVENASLMPWLMGCAIIHIMSITKNNSLIGWSSILIIINFNLSILGAFLVRSGIISSVHSFANDPTRGIYILWFMAFSLLTGFILYVFRINKISQKNIDFNLLSRKGFLILNNLFFVVSCFTVMIGTLYPLIYELIYNKKLSIGEPYYLKTFIPIMMLMSLFCIISTSFSEKKLILNKKNIVIFLFSCVLTIIIKIKYGGSFISFLWFVIGFMLVFDNLALLYKVRSFIFVKKHSMIIGHLGLGIFILGVTFVGSYSMTREYNLKIGEKIIINNKYNFELENVEYSQIDNYFTRIGKIAFYEKKNKIDYIYPELRFYPAEQSYTNDAGFLHKLFQDIYITIGDLQEDTLHTRIHLRPFINLIWLGAGLIGFSGILSFYFRMKLLKIS